MSIVQNAYPENITHGRNGQIANTTTCDVNSFVVTGDPIPFGRGCHAVNGEIEVGVSSRVEGFRRLPPAVLTRETESTRLPPLPRA